MVIAQLPSNVTNLNLTASSGSYTFNNVDRILKWDVGKLIQGKTSPPNLRGSVSTSTKYDFHIVFQIHFKINQYAASNVKGLVSFFLSHVFDRQNSEPNERAGRLQGIQGRQIHHPGGLRRSAHLIVFYLTPPLLTAHTLSSMFFIMSASSINFLLSVSSRNTLRAIHHQLT